MRVLLDTHAFLWWIGDDPRLSANARGICASAANTLWLSAASAWELAIKTTTGKLRLPRAPERYIPAQMKQNRIESLDITLAHAFRVYSLPPHHRDPFDRMLVAQAQVEGLRILTSDPLVRRYEIETVW